MKVQHFLEHHGVTENPYGQEDAQTDHVFKQHCLNGTHHPAWDKIYGSPDNPATSVVFGEKGSGKTALRLQIADELTRYNIDNPDQRVFIIEYDDFNPFLDCFRERLHGRKRKSERALASWRLWDHMDAILTLGVTHLVDVVLDAGRKSDRSGFDVKRDQLGRLSRLQKRDLLLLAALYDHTYDQPPRQRWRSLRRRLKYSNWLADWDRAAGFLIALATIGLVWNFGGFTQLLSWWVFAVILAGWLPWSSRQLKLLWTAWRVSKQVRVFDHIPNVLRHILTRFPRQELAGQPIPSKDRSDDRYELLMKLQTVLKTVGFDGIVVLIDRVDEPHLVNGSAERMRDLLWPMFDNKFLKHPGIGFKLLLPAEVVYYLNREEKAFYERSRLDKHNLVLSLEWTGESLFDVANDRLRACANSPAQKPGIRSLFDESIHENELIGIFAQLRVPRHLFKFLYRVIVDHCNRHTDDHPSWTISRETLQSTLALFQRDLETFDRGMGTG